MNKELSFVEVDWYKEFQEECRRNDKTSRLLAKAIKALREAHKGLFRSSDSYELKFVDLVLRQCEADWRIKRFCFHCKKVSEFILCDNCSHFYCVDHADIETEYGEYGSTISTYSVHKTCS